MKTFVVACLVVLVAACAPPPRRPLESAALQVAETPAMVASMTEEKGKEAAEQLTAWYGNLVTDCGSPALAAPLCSGVMLRATKNSQSYLPWDPSPNSIERGGISFSWLRADNNFASLVYDYHNGFIFYPVLDTPPGKNSDIEVLCVFPSDAYTDGRPTLQGCGPNAAYPVDSRPCSDLGITTAAQWLERYNKGDDRDNRQCGWSVREGERDQAARFMAAIGARHGLDEAVWRIQNELRLATWQPGTGADLPIQSFFYLAGDDDARSKAQNDQLRYFLNYGELVPVVAIALPASRSESATFTYESADQLDPAVLHFDTSPVTRSGMAYIISKRQDILPPFGSDNSVTRVARGGQPPYTYRSSDPSVAVVNAMGQVTPRANGTASISVTDSVGASAAYGVTFTGVIQVDYVGKLDHGQARTTVAARGERLPTHADLSRLQLDFASRWPYPPEHYWSSQSCPTGKYVSYYIHLVTSTGRCASGIEPQETIGLKGPSSERAP